MQMKDAQKMYEEGLKYERDKAQQELKALKKKYSNLHTALRKASQMVDKLKASNARSSSKNQELNKENRELLATVEKLRNIIHEMEESSDENQPSLSVRALTKAEQMWEKHENEQLGIQP